jgi:hypothetical protein
LTPFSSRSSKSENIKDDMESMELFKLYVQDELSSARWLKYACEALNGQPNATSGQSMTVQSGTADSIVYPAHSLILGGAATSRRFFARSGNLLPSLLSDLAASSGARSRRPHIRHLDGHSRVNAA